MKNLEISKNIPLPVTVIVKKAFHLCVTYKHILLTVMFQSMSDNNTESEMGESVRVDEGAGPSGINRSALFHLQN